MKTTLGIAAFALSLGLCAPALKAQVVISEIDFTKNAQWIELYNMGTKDVDVSAWSIYQANSVKPGEHWWGFPKNTFLKAGKFLRVHWLAKVQTTTATDIYTGDTVYHFLFGLFAKSLDPSRGALALMNTQANSKMNAATSIVDWVSWGTTGFKREDLAIFAKEWTKNSFAPAASGSPLPSLAYDYTLPGAAGHGGQWFLDSSPTPGANNIGNAFAKSFGSACTAGLKPSAKLVASGVPASGNSSFSIGIDRKIAASEISLQVLSVKEDPKTTFKFFGCPLYLDIFTVFYAAPVPAVAGKAEVNYGVFKLENVSFYSQWAVFDLTKGQATMTNGLHLRFGN